MPPQSTTAGLGGVISTSRGGVRSAAYGSQTGVVMSIVAVSAQSSLGHRGIGIGKMQDLDFLVFVTIMFCLGWNSILKF